MITQRFILEKYRTQKNRYTCPGCGKKQQFTRYIDLDTNEYVNENVGICNRLEKCGYHYSPGQYFKDNQIQPPRSDFKHRLTAVKQPVSFIQKELFRSSLKAYQQNNFIQFLNEKFGQEITQKLVDQYKIGTSKYWVGATIFWQLDENEKVRTGKVMLYDTNTGKRIKKPYNHIHWVHSILKLENYNLVQCLFGQHLLTYNSVSPIAIVESEKTAIICSVYYPDFIWMGAGSLSNLNPEKLQVLRNRSIVLFPDTSLNGEAFKRWEKIKDNLSGFNCIISDLLETKATPEEKQNGVDIADYLLKYNHVDFTTRSVKRILSQNEVRLQSMIEKNPSIQKMITQFDLELPKD